MPYEDETEMLTGMFPVLDCQVIVEILTDNNGSVQESIDQLLILASGIEESGEGAVTHEREEEIPVADTVHPPPANSLPNVAASSNRFHVGGGISAADSPRASETAKYEKNYKYPLPDDFLVLPKEFKSRSSAGRNTSTNADQLKSDELLAQMLANESFIEELRHDEQFSEYMGEATGSASTTVSSSTDQQRRSLNRLSSVTRRRTTPNDGSVLLDSSERPTAGSSASQYPSNEEIGQKLRDGWTKMSESARVKLGALAKRFRSKPNRDDYDMVDTFEPLMDDADRQFLDDGANDVSRRSTYKPYDPNEARDSANSNGERIAHV